MEKFTNYRDRGTGIAPFMPIFPGLSFPRAIKEFVILSLRIFIVLFISANYFTWLQFFPLPLAFHKGCRWFLLISCGIFFVDIQVDGVKRGSLSSLPKSRIPHPKSIIASNFTSPVDALYLSAVFDPIFTISFPHTKKVQKVDLWAAMQHALRPVMMSPPDGAKLTTVSSLLNRYPDRIIVVFPECSTTNGRGILPLSPSLLATPKDIDIFPLSIRYTPADVTTPVPRSYFQFFWSLLGRPSTYLRVRLADAVHNTSRNTPSTDDSKGQGGASDDGEMEEPLTQSEKKLLGNIADTLARLGRNRRVGLALKEKDAFTKAYWAVNEY
ncbi:putative lysophosphatidic acid:oleoyl-CoA acyltransferase [Zalerion maritima]|uniref:Lysophosphatidic acid:oleoyl-CoA acyltransferase n=1 Tax=Zalerion maritima TaxID=339359 RepID=A0AAD5RSB0_9PEZI|nr:putative lysophosphatidic acid:oleoyl-CoA acyltransferase [Zalerion maritima]